jgi:hypothetical protein
MKQILIIPALALSFAVGAGYLGMAKAADSTAAAPVSPGPPAPGGDGGGMGMGVGMGMGIPTGMPGPDSHCLPGPGPGPMGMMPAHPHREDFGLFAEVPDKKLTPADVRAIASAILLMHGNHSWKVADVTAEPDKSIKFSFVTAHDDVVASFAVDPVSGHIRRVD